MAVQLNEKSIASSASRAQAEARRIEMTDPRHPGLRLRITPAGTMTWVLGCRDSEGRARRVMLGKYPYLGLAEARVAAAKQHHAIKYERADPIGERKRRHRLAAAASGGEGTLGALIEAWRADKGRRLTRWDERKRRIEAVFADLIRKPAQTITQTEVQAAVDAWPSKGSAALVARYLRPVLRWGGRRGLCGLDLVHIDLPHTVQRRDRVLSRAELTRLLPALRKSSSTYAAAMLLMLLTACRRDEIAGAKFGDVDFNASTLRLPMTKNGSSFTVQLSRQALSLIRSQVPVDAPDGEAANDALIFSTRSGRRLGSWDRATKLIQETSDTSDWHRHDLRRTAATILGEPPLSVPGHVIEAVLNHQNIGGALAATYNRSRYVPESRAALQSLADYLDTVGAQG